jgi:hypothetical protein
MLLPDVVYISFLYSSFRQPPDFREALPVPHEKETLFLFPPADVWLSWIFVYSDGKRGIFFVVITMNLCLYGHGKSCYNNIHVSLVGQALRRMAGTNYGQCAQIYRRAIFL